MDPAASAKEQAAHRNRSATGSTADLSLRAKNHFRARPAATSEGSSRERLILGGILTFVTQRLIRRVLPLRLSAARLRLQQRRVKWRPILEGIALFEQRMAEMKVNAAARNIQRVWRGFATRQRLDAERLREKLKNIAKVRISGSYTTFFSHALRRSSLPLD